MAFVNPTRIALVGPLPPPFGGMANQTRQLARLLEDEEYQVEVIRTNEPHRPAWIGQVKGLRALFRLVPHLWSLWRGIRRAQLVHIMANSGWSWHLFSAPAIWIAWWLKVPVVVNYRGGEAEVFLQKSIRWIRPSLERVSRIVVPSGFLKAVFQKFDIETAIVPNIIDLNRFGRDKCKELNQEAPHIIVCRNLEPIYDVATALKGFAVIAAELPEAVLSVAGEGPDHTALIALAMELGVDSQVTFTGRLNVEEMINLYHSADLMLNASRVDNMPNALLESMAAGVPIVTTDAGGIPHMVEQGVTAELVAIGDWNAMGEKSLAILQDQQRHTELAEACIKAVEIYQWDSVKPQWQQVYNDAGKSMSDKAIV